MTLNAGFHTLWPTPLGIHRYPAAAALNPLLVRMFGALRATQSAVRGEPPGAFFASDDDLLQRVQLPEWQGLVRYFVECLRDTVTQANRSAWPASTEGTGLTLQVAIEGLWFQCTNRNAFHDVHTHGNCSWSGVYCVQPAHVDVAPVPGQLVLFPSWLAHQALPYEGELDRMVISFNASIHQAHGTDRLHGYRAA